MPENSYKPSNQLKYRSVRTVPDVNLIYVLMCVSYELNNNNKKHVERQTQPLYSVHRYLAGLRPPPPPPPPLLLVARRGIAPASDPCCPPPTFCHAKRAAGLPGSAGCDPRAAHCIWRVCPGTETSPSWRAAWVCLCALCCSVHSLPEWWWGGGGDFLLSQLFFMGPGVLSVDTKLT